MDYIWKVFLISVHILLSWLYFLCKIQLVKLPETFSVIGDGNFVSLSHLNAILLSFSHTCINNTNKNVLEVSIGAFITKIILILVPQP